MELERMRKRDPEDHIDLALFYRMLGRTNEAHAEQVMFEQQNGKDSNSRWFLASAAYVEGRYEAGIRAVTKTLEMLPDPIDGLTMLAYCQVEKGEFQKAVETIQKARELDDKQEFHALLGYTYARMGNREKADEVLRDLGKIGKGKYIQPYFIARIHAALGQKDAALDYLERARDEKSEFLVFTDWGGGGLRMDRAWDGLRDEPRFKELLKKVGLDVWPR